MKSYQDLFPRQKKEAENLTASVQTSQAVAGTVTVLREQWSIVVLTIVIVTVGGS